MSMNLYFATIFVTGGTILQGAAASNTSTSAPQVLDTAAHTEAYEIYATELSRVWLREKGALLLQQETERGFAGDPCGLLKTQTGEWADAATDFEQHNAHSWLLQLAPNYFRYQFIRRAEIEAQDARVPGTYPGRPGVTPYAAVSAVGFNRNRTKAIVAVHLRLEGWLSILELKDGKWHAVGESCKWNA